MAVFMTRHHCHAEGCDVEVHPRMFACRAHWAMVPYPLQSMLYAVYRSGQERDKRVTKVYLLVQTRCRIAIALREGRPIGDLVQFIRNLAETTPQQALFKQLEGKNDDEALSVLDAGLPKLVARYA